MLNCGMACFPGSAGFADCSKLESGVNGPVVRFQTDKRIARQVVPFQGKPGDFECQRSGFIMQADCHVLSI